MMKNTNPRNPINVQILITHLIAEESIEATISEIARGAATTGISSRIIAMDLLFIIYSPSSIVINVKKKIYLL